MKVKKNLSAKTGKTDIIKLILEDHVPLKKLIKVLKDPHIKMSEKRPSFEKFAVQLLAHAKPEEQSLYSWLQAGKSEMRIEGFEGLTEHAIAEHLIEEIRVTTDKNEWLGKVKVLGEVVEHHIHEEETSVFKLVKKEFGMQLRAEIGEEYLKQKEEYQENLKPFRKRPRSQAYELESTL